MSEKKNSRKRQITQMSPDDTFPALALPPVSGNLTRGSSAIKAYNCPICLQIFQEPYSTACGHTFCRMCISNYLNVSSPASSTKCPQCGFYLDANSTRIFPNYTAAEITDNMVREMNDEKLRNKKHRELGDPGEVETICNRIKQVGDLTAIDKVADVVTQRRVELQSKNERRRHLLMNEFLIEMIRRRETNLQSIAKELEILRADKRKISDIIEKEILYRKVPEAAASTSDVLEGEGALAATTAKVPNVDIEFEKYRDRMTRHFEGLEAAYLTNRLKPAGGDDATVSVPTSSCAADVDDFSEVLDGISQYGEIRRLASLNYNVDSIPVLSIVSSIEFDKDGEFFVVAGVTKKIKVYDYEAVIANKAGVHYPKAQLQCSSKISNVSWNPYAKNLLASSDYDGTVQLWDTQTTQKIRSFKEHEKRCWTVQFNNVDPHLMASGSDDSKVKLWSVSTERSVGTIDAKVNVCCVYFSPASRNNLVFGCADHCVHLYDIRYPSKALNVFRGHRKAVSYVKYCNENEVVSASTDSNLRVWDVNSGKCLRIMKGHTNEKNFVGLATDGNHIVCGSENNQLYLYYKGLASPLMNYDFAASADGASESNEFSSVTPGSDVSGNGDFVSAVCWKKNSNVIVAANSQGTTQILQLI